MSLEKITKVSCPFDLRNEDPSKNYGIGGLRVWFILKGSKGAVQFVVHFGIYLPHLYPEYERKFGINSLAPEITGFDVGYHSYAPQYENQSPMDCDILGSPCYYDGSSLRANDWVKEIFGCPGQSEDLIWRKLENEYELRFSSTPHADSV